MIAPDHSQLVSMAVAWLRRGVTTTHVAENGDIYTDWKRKYQPVFGEMVSTAAERPDVIGWSWGLSLVVECKCTRADFFADRSKPHMFDATSGMGRHRYYLVPHGLVSAEEVPTWCGLAYAKGRSIAIVKEAPLREISASAAISECIILASAVRRHVLKVPFDAKAGRFEPVEVRSPPHRKMPVVAPEETKL